MPINEKAKKQALNIVEWIINLAIVCVAADLGCIDCTNYVRVQFLDAVVFGYFIVISLIVIAIFIEEQEFHKIWRLVVAVAGAVLFLIAGVLALEYSVPNSEYFDSTHNRRSICVGALCLLLTIVYIIDAIIVGVKDES